MLSARQEETMRTSAAEKFENRAKRAMRDERRSLASARLQTAAAPRRSPLFDSNDEQAMFQTTKRDYQTSCTKKKKRDGDGEIEVCGRKTLCWHEYYFSSIYC